VYVKAGAVVGVVVLAAGALLLMWWPLRQRLRLPVC
jgi:hypothetical protein